MRRQVTTIIVVAGLSLTTASVAAAGPVRDSGVQVTAQQQQSATTLRSPDAADANTLAKLHAPTSFVDRRSPDARDAATSVVVPSGVITKAKVVNLSSPSSGDGFDWGSAGIGAGTIALALAGLGMLFIVRRQRHTSAPLAH